MRNLGVLLFLSSAALWSQPQVLATGLQGPHKIVLTPRGNLLVSETSMNVNAGRVSLVNRSGTRTSLIEGLPSGVEVVGGGSGPTALVLRERTLYVALGGGDYERRIPPANVASGLNPAGGSSPLFCSILEFRFGGDIDAAASPLRMTVEQQRALADGAEIEMRGDGGVSARVSVLTRFPIAEPSGTATIWRFSNIWGFALSDDGRRLYVADASNDSIALVDTTTGRWRRIVRFPPVPNRTPVGPPVTDAVPTSVRINGDDLVVSFLTGFPFVPDNARVLVVRPDGTTSPFIWNLTSAVDVLRRDRPGGGEEYFVLEFSANQSANPAPPGRLLRYRTAIPQVAAAGLITPVSMAYDESTQDLYILELRGQILRLRLE